MNEDVRIRLRYMYDRVHVLNHMYNTYTSTYIAVLRQLGNGMQIAVRCYP